MQAFTHIAHPARVIFGAGTLSRVVPEIERLGLERVLVLTTPRQQASGQALSARIGARSAGVCSEAVMHTPVSVTEAAMTVVSQRRVDGVLAVGGGSTTGLAKAIALRTGLPQIVAPTTYAGSEMTPILGETRDGAKVTRSDPRILPRVVIYDVDLTLSLPPALSGSSGINAIAHVVEALYARDRNPVVSLMAMEAIRVLFKALPKVVAEPLDREARSDALYGAWLCGTCLGQVGMALHHKLCHTLGGAFDLPHAQTHCIVLPHALAYNAPAIPEVMAQLSAALGVSDPATALFDLARHVGAKRALKDIGMPRDGIDDATDQALADPYWNPRSLERESLRGVIARAYAGDAPRP